MLNFIFVALCTWITTFLPFKDVSVPSANEEVVEVERKSRDNYFSYNGYVVASIQEVLTNNHFYTFAFLPQQHFDTTNTIGTTLTTTRANVGTGLIRWFDSGISHDDLGYSSVVGLSDITYKLNAQNVQNNVFVQVWETTINLSNNEYLKYTIECYYNSVSGVSYGNALLGVNIGSLISTTFGFSSLFITPSSTDFGVWITNEHSLSGDYQTGYDIGYNAGKDYWYNSGVDYGEQHPNQDLVDEIYDRGYAYGYSEGLNSDAVLSTIFTGILDVSFIPVNVFLQMFNYEILGVNIAGLVSGLVTVALLLILIRFVTGRRV